MPHPVDVHVGARLRELRRSGGQSQKLVASQLGISFQQLHKYECGHNRISASVLWSLCSILNVSPAAFFEGISATARAPATPATVPDTLARRTGRQVLNLNRYFIRLPDPAVRARILALIKTLGQSA